MSRTQREEIALSREIGSRLIGMLKGEFGFTMTEAASRLGYKNATTLHQVRRGKALPDPARLALFAQENHTHNGKVMNLHWVWTGRGTRLLDQAKASQSSRPGPTSDDFINTISGVDPVVKEAILVLITNRRQRIKPRRRSAARVVG